VTTFRPVSPPVISVPQPPGDILLLRSKRESRRHLAGIVRRDRTLSPCSVFLVKRYYGSNKMCHPVTLFYTKTVLALTPEFVKPPEEALPTAFARSLHRLTRVLVRGIQSAYLSMQKRFPRPSSLGEYLTPG
jgi:hypothetical protein